jgi:hypothetical protein
MRASMPRAGKTAKIFAWRARGRYLEQVRFADV